ncbi:MAG: hypothetical protein M0P57_00100 [Syntrophales bacterium]|jgi:hypothetical protein|nr:hypothetical protein [Syntrophales bacterium]MDY0045022.1 hypothetical protein [Syntrophales bacterium]
MDLRFPRAAFEPVTESMFKYELTGQPLFYLFAAFSFLLAAGYFWGKRQNKKIFLAAFRDIIDVIKPDDQRFVNIGGSIGYHANLFIKKKKAAISQVDATIVLLPRQSWLYLPVSKLIRHFDRLFITFYFKKKPLAEGHLIENRYNKMKRSSVANAEHLQKEALRWGTYDFLLYYDGEDIKNKLINLMDNNPDPGIIRHIAVVPEQKKGFLFMIPKKNQVAQYFTSVYYWLSSLV